MIDLLTVASKVATIAGALGIFAAFLNIRQARRVARCQLINQLEDDLAKKTRFMKRFREGRDLSVVKEDLSECDEELIEFLIAFCERLEFFRRSKLLGIPEIEERFGARFKGILSNGNVERVLKTFGDGARPFNRLRRDWENHRSTGDLPSPRWGFLWWTR